MINFQSVDAVTANVTNATFTPRFAIVDGLFGLPEFETALSFPERHGRSRTLSVLTSDVAILVFALLVITFAIDRYLFKSRYMVHIGGARKQKDQSTILGEKALLHEKEAFTLESGETQITDKNSEPAPDAASLTPKTRQRWTGRLTKVLFMLPLMLLYHTFGIDKIKSKSKKDVPESSSEKPEVEESAAIPSPWDKFKQYAWSCAALFLVLFIILATLATVTFHLVFWLCLLLLDIMVQCAFFDHTTTWQSIAPKAILRYAIWTVVMVTLLEKPNRLRVPLWRCLKWTHAMTWWSFWIIVQSHSIGALILSRVGLPYTGFTTTVLLSIMRPILVAYYHSGVLFEVILAVRYVKYFWERDIFNP